MAHFAKVENGIVTSVIVIDQETLNTGHWGDPALWIQTSYNTSGGQHPEGRPLHKNYAGIGYTWDGTGFAPPQPYPSWTRNNGNWIPPVAYPQDDNKYTWNEQTLSWDLLPL